MKKNQLLLFVSLLFAFSFAHASPPKEKLLWDSWYTVQVGKGMKYAYYNEKVTLSDGKILFQNKFWKKEEGYINQEQLGAVAAADEKLTPMFFNFRSVYRTTETRVDGTVKDGKILSAKARRAGKDLPTVSKSLPKDVIFTSIFPVWLKEQWQKLDSGKTLSFVSLLEDDVDTGFATAHGRVRLEPSDELSKKTKTRKGLVDFRNMKSTWYVLATGEAVRIEIPAQETLVERVDRAKAEKFLDE